MANITLEKCAECLRLYNSDDTDIFRCDVHAAQYFRFCCYKCLSDHVADQHNYEEKVSGTLNRSE